MMEEDESLVSLAKGIRASLSGMPFGQKESEGSFVMASIGTIRASTPP
jgi:hypothetical protein